jgi:hypothetical protein
MSDDHVKRFGRAYGATAGDFLQREARAVQHGKVH